jgi:hypothetical protein
MPAAAVELQIVMLLPLLLVQVVWAVVVEAAEKVLQVQHSRLLPVT